jgi:hypothetical protein
MSVLWRLVKTASRVHAPWRANLKQYENFFRHDHYYSPIPVIEEVERRKAAVFDRGRRDVPGVDLRDAAQLALLRQLEPFARELPFPLERSPECRYWLNNKFYPYADGVTYYALLRHARPRRVMEVGSGFSSAVCLDTNDRYFEGQIECTFIDPDTCRLDELLSEADRRRVTVLPRLVQDVPLDEFRRLEAGDVLFLDSSHVGKVGSDVNHLFFEVLPALKAGVYIHLHDVFYPFEYPEAWIYGGRAWNEAYLLRAFLQFNDAFQLVLWPDYLNRFHSEALHRHLPHCHQNSGSIWIQKRR